MGLFNHFAEASPSIHVAPAADFTIGGIHVTNSMLYGWIVASLLIVSLIYLTRKVTLRPKGGVVQYLEAVVDFVIDLVEGAFNDKAIGRKYVPFFVTLFFFILLNNWAGLIPIVGRQLRDRQAVGGLQSLPQHYRRAHHS